MKEKIYNIIELISSALLILFGVAVATSASFIENYVQYTMIGFVVIKIVLVIYRSIIFKLNKPFTVIESVLNAAIIVLLFIFKQVNALSFVVSASCLLDLSTNIVKSIIFRKSDNPMLKTSFFGMENIIYIIFIVMLIFNRESSLVATGVLFGVIILYKGVALFVGNHIVRSLINKTDFGVAVNKVRGLDIFLGLVVIVVLAAFIFPQIEPSISTAGDALWYCFTVITTIGFGDIAAETTSGRILSVIIGCYGIVIVSILTSAFVVYLNRVSKNEDKVINETYKKDKDNKKKEKE